VLCCPAYRSYKARVAAQPSGPGILGLGFDRYRASLEAVQSASDAFSSSIRLSLASLMIQVCTLVKGAMADVCMARPCWRRQMNSIMAARSSSDTL
jgi:hypothetical protein